MQWTHSDVSKKSSVSLFLLDCNLALPSLCRLPVQCFQMQRLLRRSCNYTQLDSACPLLLVVRRRDSKMRSKSNKRQKAQWLKHTYIQRVRMSVPAGSRAIDCLDCEQRLDCNWRRSEIHKHHIPPPDPSQESTWNIGTSAATRASHYRKCAVTGAICYLSQYITAHVIQSYNTCFFLCLGNSP